MSKVQIHHRSGDDWAQLGGMTPAVSTQPVKQIALMLPEDKWWQSYKTGNLQSPSVPINTRMRVRL